MYLSTCGINVFEFLMNHLGGGLVLDDELSEPGQDEETTLLHLGLADGTEGTKSVLGLLALQTRERDHVVDQLGLGHVLAFGGGDGHG